MLTMAASRIRVRRMLAAFLLFLILVANVPVGGTQAAS
jgi:hypothetical protein